MRVAHPSSSLLPPACGASAGAGGETCGPRAELRGTGAGGAGARTRGARTRRAPRQRDDGFTLLEILIVIAIVALMSTLGAAGVRNVAKSQLRADAAQLSGAMRYLFDRASTTGKMYRLVLDLDNQKYFAETSDDRFYLPGEPETEEQLRVKAEKIKQEDEEAKRKAESAQSSGDDTAKYMPQEFRPKRAQFAAFKDASLKPVTLKKSKIALVFTPRLIEPVTKGRAYIYFFPLGQTEAADVQISDTAGDSFFSLLVHPVTGRVRIQSGAVAPPIPQDMTDDVGAQVGQ